MNLIDGFTLVSTTLGLVFFFTGSLGMLRFPDVFSRLHALTKADNLGLGFIILGLLPQVHSYFDMAQLLLIWLFIMVTSAVSSYLVANYAVHHQTLLVVRDTQRKGGTYHER